MGSMNVIVLGLTWLLLAPPGLVLLLQVVMAMRRLGAAPAIQGERPRVAILVPAHNEAHHIADTLEQLVSQLVPSDRLIVVADNCSDDTAAVAARAGATVVCRDEPELRGKGFALDYGVRFLGAGPPDVVIVIDADCHLSAGVIDRLSRYAHASGRPVQALYLMHAHPGSSVMKRIGEFAWNVRNFLRPLGFYRLGLPCQLMGTGMAFPWHCIETASLATGHIVEDMKLGIELAIGGKAPLFYPYATVSSFFPSDMVAADEQKKRWEHGHLGIVLSEAPALIVAAFRQRSVGLAALALDLCVPPLSLFLMMVLTILAVMFFWSAVTAWWPPLILGVVLFALPTLAVVLAWWRIGRGAIDFAAVAMVFFYAFRKIPLYLKFLFNRQAEWVRSKRDGE